jgi:hypothetical protein
MRSIIQAEIAGELILPMALIPLIIKAKSKSERLYAKSRTKGMHKKPDRTSGFLPSLSASFQPGI